MKELENNDKGQRVFEFGAKLLSISPNQIANVNGTMYHVVNMSFTDAQGVLQKTSGIMYAKNAAHGVAVGEEYLTQATITEKGPFIQMSHLPANAPRATLDMFIFDGAEVKTSSAPATANKEVPANM